MNEVKQIFPDILEINLSLTTFSGYETSTDKEKRLKKKTSELTKTINILEDLLMDDNIAIVESKITSTFL